MRDWVVSGEAIRARRLQLRMRQDHFAEACGRTRSFIKYVEAGDCQPNDVNGLLMADVLGCDIADIATPKTARSTGSAA